MKLSKRFQIKYKEDYAKIMGIDLSAFWESWEKIVNSSMFNHDDLIETLDYLVKFYKDEVSDFSDPSLYIFGSEQFDEMMHDLSDKEADKYQDFFIKINSHYSLNEMMHSIIYHYGDKLDWDTILTNTLFDESDGFQINNRGMTMIETYYDVMFSKVNENKSYRPADSSLFFVCLELGVDISYRYMKASIFNDSTTFVDELLGLILHIFAEDMDVDETPFIIFTPDGYDGDPISICVVNLHSRISFDEEMLGLIEAVQKTMAAEEDEDDFGDDIGF